MAPSQYDAQPLTREDVLSLREAAELLGVPRSTLCDLARRREVPAVKLGKRWVFRRSLLNARTQPAAADTTDTHARARGGNGLHRAT